MGDIFDNLGSGDIFDQIDSGGTSPTFKSEAGRVGLQALSGLTGDILNSGNKPMSELVAGQVGTSAMRGASLRADPREAFNRFMLGGFGNMINTPEIPEARGSDIGIPALPMPETTGGRIAGGLANMAGQALLYGGAEKFSNPIRSIKPTPYMMKKELLGIDKALSDVTARRLETAPEFKKGIEANAASGGVALKDSFFKFAKAMRGKYSPKYDKLLSEQQLPKQNVLEALNKTMQELGLKETLDVEGRPIPARQPSGKAEQALIDYVGELNAEAPKGKILDANGRPIQTQYSDFIKGSDVLRRFRSVMKENAGKIYSSSEHALTRLKENLLNPIKDSIEGLKDLNLEFAKDAQLRDFLYKISRPFDKANPAAEKFLTRVGKGSISSAEMEALNNLLARTKESMPSGLRENIRKLIEINKRKSAMAEESQSLRAKKIRLSEQLPEAEKSGALKAMAKFLVRKGLRGLPFF